MLCDPRSDAGTCSTAKQLIALIKDPTTQVTRGTTYENLQNLADAFR